MDSQTLILLLLAGAAVFYVLRMSNSFIAGCSGVYACSSIAGIGKCASCAEPSSMTPATEQAPAASAGYTLGARKKSSSSSAGISGRMDKRIDLIPSAASSMAGVAGGFGSRISLI